MMARTSSPRPVELFLSALLAANALHVILRAACPAAPPWPRQFEPPAALAEYPGRSIDGATTRRDPTRPPPAFSGAVPGARASGAHRGAPRSRRRGRRGGVNWSRHGDSGTERLILGHLNVQSLKPKLPDLRADIQTTYGFDILALSETWLAPNIPDRLVIVSGYTLYRGDRPDELNLPKGRGGVALLVRSGLRSERLPKPDTGVGDIFVCYILWVLVHLGKNRTVLIASVYRVPNANVRQLTADFDDLEGQIQFMIAKHPRSTLVLCGDFNRCLLKTSLRDNHSIQRLFETYGIAVTNCTRATYRPSGSLLDVIATNRPDLVSRSGVTRCHYGSPHDFSRVILAYPPAETAAARQKYLYLRPTNRIDQTAFNEQLFSADWTDVFNSEETSQKWLSFRHAFLFQLNLVAPLRRACVRELRAPPVAAETRRLIRSRRAALDSGERADYLRVNRLCRAAIRRDCVSLYASEIRQRGRGGNCGAC